MEKEKQEKQEVKLPKPILLEDLGMMYPTEDSKHKVRFGVYKCGFCGNEFKARISLVKCGNTKSCGCYHKKKMTKHGLINNRLYSIWRNMKKRTLNPQHTHYQSYGGRGITICEEWKNDFMSFYSWAMSNGYGEELSIDRIDNDGNYEPNNCRWTTQTIQSRNQRIQKNNTSGFRGIYLDKRTNKYKSRISVDKKKINLGSFSTAVEAGIAYNNYILDNNLEGYILNEIPEKV